MNKIFKYISLVLLLIFLYNLYIFAKDFKKKKSIINNLTKEYVEFLRFIPVRSSTLFYVDKKPDTKLYFMLHYIFAPDKVLLNHDKKHKFDYVLIKDFHKVKQKKKYRGDTLHTVRKKKYSIHLLKVK